MNVTIKIPSPLRRFTENNSTVKITSENVGGALDLLVDQYPKLKDNILDDNGRLRNFINIYLGDQDINEINGLETTLKDGDNILLIPAIAGGSVNNGTLDKDEYIRYSRHFNLPEIGRAGQSKLKQASVLIIGAGGLGSPLGLYLTAAGVGHIGIVDYDTVDVSNLQRQVLFSHADVGKPKTQMAKNRLQSLNPKLEITTYNESLSSENVNEIFKPYDIIVDGTDNFPTRYLVNDVCVFQKKPNVYGSIYRFDGQLSFFYGDAGPCYRCLFPDPPPPGLVPSCAEGGVLGVLPGIIGSLQACEVIKYLTGAGDLMIGRLLLFEALTMRFTEVKISKKTDCPVCGENPSITEPIDYLQFCGVKSIEEEVSVNEISVREVRNKQIKGEDFQFIDVREMWEWEIANLEGAKLIPKDDIPDNLKEIDFDKEIIVLCKSGIRSADVVKYLINQGYTNVFNMTGGILEWQRKIDNTLMPY